jgi:N-hydroxyarylamine O-acetyltransferase
MSEDVKLSAYLDRIGYSGSIAPTLPTLEALHLLHPAAIPFENLNSLLRLPVLLDQASLNQKLLVEHRGGYCFEHNMLLLRVLADLGYEVHAHTARVLWGRAQAGLAEPTHMVLTVDIGGASYLADVGFGGLTLTAPLKVRSGVEQETPGGRFRLSGEGDELLLEAERGPDDWRPVYSLAKADADEADIVAINDRVGADPDWFFHHHLLVELSPKAGRRMLVDTRLTLEGQGEGEGEAGREVRTLATVAELREALLGEFGIDPAGLEGLDAVLSRLIAQAVPVP